MHLSIDYSVRVQVSLGHGFLLLTLFFMQATYTYLLIASLSLAYRYVLVDVRILFAPSPQRESDTYFPILTLLIAAYYPIPDAINRPMVRLGWYQLLRKLPARGGALCMPNPITGFGRPSKLRPVRNKMDLQINKNDKHDGWMQSCWVTPRLRRFGGETHVRT